MCRLHPGFVPDRRHHPLLSFSNLARHPETAHRHSFGRKPNGRLRRRNDSENKIRVLRVLRRHNSRQSYPRHSETLLVYFVQRIELYCAKRSLAIDREQGGKTSSTWLPHLWIDKRSTLL